jgi:hypothetical protein
VRLSENHADLRSHPLTLRHHCDRRGVPQHPTFSHGPLRMEQAESFARCFQISASNLSAVNPLVDLVASEPSASDPIIDRVPPRDYKRLAGRCRAGSESLPGYVSRSRALSSGFVPPCKSRDPKRDDASHFAATRAYAGCRLLTPTPRCSALRCAQGCRSDARRDRGFCTPGTRRAAAVQRPPRRVNARLPPPASPLP